MKKFISLALVSLAGCLSFAQTIIYDVSDFASHQLSIPVGNGKTRMGDVFQPIAAPAGQKWQVESAQAAVLFEFAGDHDIDIEFRFYKEVLFNAGSPSFFHTQKAEYHISLRAGGRGIESQVRGTENVTFW